MNLNDKNDDAVQNEMSFPFNYVHDSVVNGANEVPKDPK